MKLLAPAALAAVCILMSCGPASASGVLDAVQTFTLKNGLRVVLAPDSGAMGVDVSVFHPAGTSFERNGLRGASHLLERLMFRGAPTVPDGEHVRRLAAEGGIANTSMSPDYACYWETLPAAALGSALELEAARMAGLAVTPASFEAERRAAITDARAGAQRVPVASALAKLRARMFEGHPYARTPFGTQADLQRMTAGSLEAWRREHQAAGHSVLVIVGRFEPVATLARVRQLFEGLPRGPVAAFAPIPPVPDGERRGWSRGETPTRLLVAGWRTPGANDPDTPAVELLSEVLGGGEHSRLRQALVELGGLAVATQCGVTPQREATTFWTLAALTAEADSGAVENTLLYQVGRLVTEPIAGPEFELARARLVTAELFRLQGLRDRAQAFGQAQFYAGDAAAVSRRLAAFDRLTPADLQRVAQRVLTEGSRVVIWYVPAAEGR